MKDSKGNEIYEKCVLKYEGGDYGRVDYVGEKKIICAQRDVDIDTAEKTEYSSCSWSKMGIDEWNVHIVRYPLLPTKDKNGHNLRKFDWVEDEGGRYYQALDGIKSLTARGRDFVILKDSACLKGWSWNNSQYITFLSRPTDQDNMIEIKGKKYSEDTIQEALKEYTGG